MRVVQGSLFEINHYPKAPLPFLGQKRYFLPKFKALIKSEFKAYSNALWLDVFGGSGLLSHHIKQVYPYADVVYNDFDNYTKRLTNAELTDKIINEILQIVKDEPMKQKISTHKKEKILNLIKEYETKGYFIDYITISSALLFSGKYALDFKTLCENVFYKNKNSEQKTETNGYLQGVRTIRGNATDIINRFNQQHDNIVLVLDPPYLQTIQGGYLSHYTLKEFLRLINLIKPPFIMFGSHKSDILPFFDFMCERGEKALIGYKMAQTKLSLGTFGDKTDYMIYKTE